MDNLYFTEEHLMLRDMVREFAINEIRPLSPEIDKKSILFNFSIFARSVFMFLSVPWHNKKVHINISLGPINDSFELRFCLNNFRNKYLCFGRKYFLCLLLEKQ